MKTTGNFQGRLRFVLNWPLFCLPVVLLLAGTAVLIVPDAGIAALAFLCLYAVLALWWMFFMRRSLMGRIVEFAEQFNENNTEQLYELPVPYALANREGTLLWSNAAFAAMMGDRLTEQSRISAVFPELTAAFPETGERRDVPLHFDGSEYRVGLSGLSCGEDLISLCFFDETTHLETLRTIEDQKIAVGQIYIDNYEELMNSIESVRQSLLAALIERKIAKYFSSHDGLVNKSDKDRYNLIINKKGLEEIKADRFSLLEDIKSISVGNEIRGTLSMGIGVDAPTLAANQEYARVAIDLCLGRGGDQVIVKDPDGTLFYGGKTQQQERGTRVKARVKAKALKELLSSADRILITGHSNPDVDALGSAVGVYRAAVTLGRKANIILKDIHPDIKAMASKLLESGDYPKDFFVTPEEAGKLADESTILVYVDGNRTALTDCPELFERIPRVVVLDHHRQGGDSVTRATLSYIEPYASSASEMVAEILQYLDDNVKVSPLEAEAMCAGIVVDTNNFRTKTGVRTFEAAAYLRGCGADMGEVRKLFRENVKDLQTKAEIVSNMEVFRDGFALGICPAEGLDSPIVVGAQAANDMLDISGIKASMVFTKLEDEVYISARSIDEMNVQLIMERLGGGGHMNAAATQLKGCALADAIQLVKETIIQMEEEGAI